MKRRKPIANTGVHAILLRHAAVKFGEHVKAPAVTNSYPQSIAALAWLIADATQKERVGRDGKRGKP